MTQPVEDIEKLASKIEVAVAGYDQAGFDERRYEIIKDLVTDGFAVRDAELRRLRELLQESITHLETRANHARYMADESKWQADQDAYTNIANATCGLLTKIESALQ